MEDVVENSSDANPYWHWHDMGLTAKLEVPSYADYFYAPTVY